MGLERARQHWLERRVGHVWPDAAWPGLVGAWPDCGCRIAQRAVSWRDAQSQGELGRTPDRQIAARCCCTEAYVSDG